MRYRTLPVKTPFPRISTVISDFLRDVGNVLVNRGCIINNLYASKNGYPATRNVSDFANPRWIFYKPGAYKYDVRIVNNCIMPHAGFLF